MIYGTPTIVTDGLAGYFDIVNPISYTSGSLLWKDLTGNCDLILTGSGINPTYWVGSGEALPSIATSPLNIQQASNDFTLSAWNKNKTGYTSTITASAVSAPPGLPGLGSKLNETTINSRHGIQGGIDTSIGTPFRISFYAKAAERSWIRYENADWSSFFINFDLVNGVTGSNNPGPVTINGVRFGLYDPKIEEAGEGWWRCSFYIISSYDRMTITLCSIIDNSTFSFIGDPTSGVYVYGVNASYGTENVPYVDVSTTSSMNEYSTYLEYTGSAITENNEHSVFTWVKGFTSFNSRNNIYSKYTGSSPSSGFICYVGNSAVAYIAGSSFSSRSINPSFFNNPRPFTSHGWCQIGITRSSTQTKIYWNGINVYTFGKVIVATNTATVKFGSNAGEGLNSAWNSSAGLGFGNILIYDRALTDEEAMQNFNSMKTRFRLTSPQTQFGLRTTTGN
jgi:hypothetical protein